MLLGIMLNHGIMLGENGEYLASSPDELSLLNGAKYMGFTMIKQSLNEIQIEYHNKVHVYKILFQIEFDSTRKRMTTIVKSEDGKVIVFCKGADTICLPLTRFSDPLKEKTIEYLDEYAKHGLRTLLFLKREITEEDFIEWHETYNKAAVLPGKQRDEAVEKAYSLIEKDFAICGSTAIEDRL